MPFFDSSPPSRYHSSVPSLHYPLSLFLNNTLGDTDFRFLGPKQHGKVRDIYRSSPHAWVFITTDRQSAFDVSWCTIPLKGHVLNALSTWWFQKVHDILPTHILAVPDPNVVVVKPLHMIPIEIVVRAYLTGSTQTSIWHHYKNGGRNFCGNALPEGMVHNQPLPSTLITPTTKSDTHDELLDPTGIVARSLATRAQWEEVTDAALRLFRRGQRVAAERGLILVDTKYEMGYDDSGHLTLADEIHTPDSSRYWIANTYQKRFQNGEEPESLDKEFFRKWLKDKGYRHDGPKPIITNEVRLQLAEKYIALYERMTGEPFPLPSHHDILSRIERNLRTFLQSSPFLHTCR